MYMCVSHSVPVKKLMNRNMLIAGIILFKHVKLVEYNR